MHFFPVKTLVSGWHIMSELQLTCFDGWCFCLCHGPVPLPTAVRHIIWTLLPHNLWKKSFNKWDSNIYVNIMVTSSSSVSHFLSIPPLRESSPAPTQQRCGGGGDRSFTNPVEIMGLISIKLVEPHYNDTFFECVYVLLERKKIWWHTRHQGDTIRRADAPIQGGGKVKGEKWMGIREIPSKIQRSSNSHLLQAFINTVQLSISPLRYYSGIRGGGRRSKTQYRRVKSSLSSLQRRCTNEFRINRLWQEETDRCRVWVMDEEMTIKNNNNKVRVEEKEK